MLFVIANVRGRVGLEFDKTLLTLPHLQAKSLMEKSKRVQSCHNKYRTHISKKNHPRKSLSTSNLFSNPIQGRLKPQFSEPAYQPNTFEEGLSTDFHSLDLCRFNPRNSFEETDSQAGISNFPPRGKHSLANKTRCDQGTDLPSTNTKSNLTIDGGSFCLSDLDPVQEKK